VNSVTGKEIRVHQLAAEDNAVTGEFVDFDGERYYAIHNVDRMPPFFVSVISSDDHWLFASSTGGLTAGRVSPGTALFPYITVDKIHDSTPHTGSKTIVRVHNGETAHYWEPFAQHHDRQYTTSRNLYKNLLGNKLCFEEINHDLELAFRYTWLTSSSYGFVRQCTLQNLGGNTARLDLLDGLQNILPAGTPMFTQTNSSNLVDAYKWSELDESTGLAFLSLYSGITDRAEPCESLKTTTAFCLGLDGSKVLISSDQIGDFEMGRDVVQEKLRRGVRCAYLVSHSLELSANGSESWRIVANLEQSQADVAELRQQLRQAAKVDEAISLSIADGSDRLARIMAAGDAFQATAEENVSAHHYANVLFNILRGGVFDDQYNVSARDFRRTIRSFNRDVYRRNADLLDGLPDKLRFDELMQVVRTQGDLQLERLCREYLPITFGRRHGDPSRPWNQFAIRLKDDDGGDLLSYEGNWRDIFQNWEALAFSYPGFVENIIAKFVNASTMDGYNPYRITKEGIDWEVEELDNPWSYIGYWGDHQIIYLQKLLELSNQFHPTRLRELLHEPVFGYANVPYRIKPFAALLENPKATVDFDADLAERIEHRVETMGADGKLVLDGDNAVYQVTLLEKLLVPLLCKLSNLVIDGGIWLNTQRPEWNDANNALVGQGLSMVTLYYMRRYIRFLQQLIIGESRTINLSREVSDWLVDTAAALSRVRPKLGSGPIAAQQRYDALVELGEAASRYREIVYRQGSFSGTGDQSIEQVTGLLDDALSAVDHSIANNRRDDGLYHAYNVLHFGQNELEIGNLYPMLEGQVAALSAGAVDPREAGDVLEALFASKVYRDDQHSFMLYPDRNLPGFLEKNRLTREQVESVPVLAQMLRDGDERILLRDVDDCYRFNAEFTNSADLKAEIDVLAESYGDALASARAQILDLYEQVFNHKAFTGRSGTMFGFEGLGSIYWHMVSKLLLAVQENFFTAVESGTDTATCHRLGQLYYRVRAGIGFNKTPGEYGAFPTDPYSHTPKHVGARQPGMTGQVKEEVLTRWGELGIRVAGGVAHFRPALLRHQEFVNEARKFCFLDVDGNWTDVEMPADGLGFTWCQVPVIYRLVEESKPSITIIRDNGDQQTSSELVLNADDSAAIFERSGRIRQLVITFGKDRLFAE
jgi:hypothetical protein